MSSRKSQILTTAAQLFKERGYSAVTMRDLAAAMDMKAASLYNHIAGKQAILSSLVLDLATRFSTGMDDVVGGNVSAFAKAEQLITLHIDLAMSHTDALAVMNNDWMHLEGAAYTDYIQQRKEYETHFRNVLKNGMVSGEFNSFDLDTVLFAILSTLRTLYIYVPKKNAEEVARFRIELPKILLQGLSK